MGRICESALFQDCRAQPFQQVPFGFGLEQPDAIQQSWKSALWKGREICGLACVRGFCA